MIVVDDGYDDDDDDDSDVDDRSDDGDSFVGVYDDDYDLVSIIITA